MTLDLAPVHQLTKSIKQHRLTFSLSDHQDSLGKIYYIRLDISAGEITLSIPVEDEYEDAPSLQPLIMYQLVLQECEEFEEAEDFNIWCSDMGHDSSDIITRHIYEELENTVPELRKIIGSDVKAIPLYDMEMNTGLAQALRSMVID